MICVVGAGPGALSVAADLSRRGHDTALINRRLDTLGAVAESARVRVTEDGGTWEVALGAVSDDVEHFVERSDVVVLVVPAAAHGLYVGRMVSVLRAGQTVLLMPGSTGGAFAASRMIVVAGIKGVCVAETDTLPYVARRVSSGHVQMYCRLRQLLCAPFASTRWAHAVEYLRAFFPPLRPAVNVLQTSLMNFNAILHPTGMLLNAGRIEGEAPFRFYEQGFPAFVGRVVKALDQERLEILHAFGLPPVSFPEYFFWAGYGPPPDPTDSVTAIMQGSAANAMILAPQNLEHRFLTEDVPFGLMPMVELGAAAGLPCETMRAVMTLARAGSAVLFEEPSFSGASVFNGRSLNEIQTIVEEGWPIPIGGGAHS